MGRHAAGGDGPARLAKPPAVLRTRSIVDEPRSDSNPAEIGPFDRRTLRGRDSRPNGPIRARTLTRAVAGLGQRRILSADRTQRRALPRLFQRLRPPQLAARQADARKRGPRGTRPASVEQTGLLDRARPLG